MNANATGSAKLYRAEYASAGCLPDNVAYFSSRADAEEYVKGMTADDDTEADGNLYNLYTWSICELSDAEVLDLFAQAVRAIDCIDHVQGDVAYSADAAPEDYRTGRFSLASYALDRPGDGEWAYAYNGNGSICRDSNSDTVAEYRITRISYHYQPCESAEPCGDGQECGGFCTDSPIFTEWETVGLLIDLV